MLLLHIRQNRRRAKVFVNPRDERHSAFSDFSGEYPKDEWTVTVYDGLEDFAPIFEQTRATCNRFEVRPVNSPKDSWETVYLIFGDDGWYLTPDPWNN